MAAALTYYTVLAVFPALLCLVSVLKISGMGDTLVPQLSALLNEAIPDPQVAATAVGVVTAFFDSSGAGLGLLAGIVTALWSASGYVGAFTRAANRTYEVVEGRGAVRLKATQLAITATLLLGAAAAVAAMTLTGSVASWLAGQWGLGDDIVWVWNLARWPLVVLVAMTLVGVLFRFTPNVVLPRRRPLTPGSVLAVVVAVGAAWGFSAYARAFGSYDATYGTLAGVIIGLLGLWLVNLAMVIGVHLDAQRLRMGQVEAGDLVARRQVGAEPREVSGIIAKQRQANELASRLADLDNS